MLNKISLLFGQNDGSLIIFKQNNSLSLLGDNIKPGEEPLEAAKRIAKALTPNINIDRMQFYRTSSDGNHYIFNVPDVHKSEFKNNDIVILRSIEDVINKSIDGVLKKILIDYFEGFRVYLFYPDIPTDVRQSLYNTFLEGIVTGHKPSTLAQPVTLACTGLVAAGKSTVTGPLAETIDCVTLSSDKVREMFFVNGYNFSGFRPFMNELLEDLKKKRYNIFLDFNISTNLSLLEDLKESGYKIFVIHANPPEKYIKDKILSGKMKHELTFFAKDEHVYESMLTWRDEFKASLKPLKEEFGIWHEVDTSRKDLQEEIDRMINKFKNEIVK